MSRHAILAPWNFVERPDRSVKTLLWLQITYIALALGFNAVSFVVQQSTGAGIAPLNPVFGFLFIVAAFAPCVFLGFRGYFKAHAVYALILSVVSCFIGGVVPHAQKYLAGDLSGYASVGALLTGASINFFGAVVFLVSAVAAWRLNLKLG